MVDNGEDPGDLNDYQVKALEHKLTQAFRVIVDLERALNRYPRLGSAAMTSYVCLKCEVEYIAASSITPTFCDACTISIAGH